MASITVMQWQRALLFTDGRFTLLLEPGRHRYRRRRTVVHTIDIRPRGHLVPGQELLTSDGVTLKLSAWVVWRIADPLVYFTAAISIEQLVHNAVQLAMRDAVASATFDEVIADRARLSVGLLETVTAQTTGLGVELTSVLIKDLMLSGDLRRAATETLLAREKGRAELERARAEAATLRTLANVARLLDEHPSLLRLRTIQAATTPGATIVLSPEPRSTAP